MLHLDLYLICFAFDFFLLTLQEKYPEIWPSVWDFQMASGPARVETVSPLDHTTDCPEIQDEWPQAKSRVIHLWRFTLYESNAFRTYQLPTCLICSLAANQAATPYEFLPGFWSTKQHTQEKSDIPRHGRVEVWGCNQSDVARTITTYCALHRSIVW